VKCPEAISRAYHALLSGVHHVVTAARGLWRVPRAPLERLKKWLFSEDGFVPHEPDADTPLTLLDRVKALLFAEEEPPPPPPGIGWWGRLKWWFGEGLSASPPDAASDAPSERRRSPPPRSGWSGLVRVLPYLGVLVLVIWAVRAAMPPSAEKQEPARGTEATDAALSEEPPDERLDEPDVPATRFVLADWKQQEIRETIAAWLGIVRPGLGEEVTAEQVARVRTIVGIKAEEVATDPDFTFGEDGDSAFITDLSAACIAGRRERPHLIVTVGRPVFSGDGYSFAVSWRDHLYEVQQLDEGEGGIADAFVADFDGDGIAEAVVTWRQGSGGYLDVAVHKLLPGNRWRCVWSSGGHYQGSAGIMQPEGSGLPTLVVVSAIGDYHDWDLKPYRVEEHAWDAELETLTQVREGFTDEDWDPQEVMGPVGPMGIPLTFDAKRVEPE
jgi:hypothetical protein